MADTLGVGILGCGNISAAYLRLAPMFKGIKIRAVADINPAAAEARAAEFGVRAESVDGLMAATDVDIIVNLTIPNAHFETSMAALRAGKHVYSEKPFVLSLDEGQQIKALSEEKGLRVGSAPDTFLGGVHQHARHLIDTGAVGKITSGTAHVMSFGLEHWHPNPDFFFQPGAGPVLDIGPYYITNLIQLIGPIARVSAMTATPRTKRLITSEPRNGEYVEVTTPTTIHALLEFASGAVVTLGTSWDVFSHRHGNMELYGEKGSLYVPDPNFFGGPLEITEKTTLVALPEGWDHPFEKVNDGERANYRTAGLADMAVAIQEGRKHRCDQDLALHAVDVMTSILKAGETGQVLEITTTCERPEALGPDAARALMK
ncbi:Gfo/Idh/MocA family protein [Pseudoruegeria sp. SHC-113]|uniref:Gfo/Idh/MocA family protein n=1 Tax=Pseudoruegeria sp. SHC-113 TaxID=2855439 RepID=UPI0021BADAAD|nr:Gfo/Idh/MocA family oxidoreductase [Pseudoruegeria sp. SHC-113]MCT8161790.1 Gfo/Idh/MocA family oxidoreductase [Pseudoruegeria sp. SHC-113]